MADRQQEDFRTRLLAALEDPEVAVKLERILASRARLAALMNPPGRSRG